jgi:hypothetical protein
MIVYMSWIWRQNSRRIAGGKAVRVIHRLDSLLLLSPRHANYSLKTREFEMSLNY